MRDHTPADGRSAEVATRFAVEGIGLRKVYPLRRSFFGRVTESVVAVDGVSVAVEPGRTLGIVGESASGKSTVARLLAKLVPVDDGEIRWDGVDVTAARGRALRPLRGRTQMIFQDPYGSLDASYSIGYSVAEPLLVHRKASRAEAKERVADLLERVNLDPRLADRRPGELSGGQRQRVSIARALALQPTTLIADEPTSALDVSTRAEILNLLLELQESMGLAILLISHDFATIRHLSHRVAVMYRGKVVEEGPADQVVDDPQDPYTRRLLDSVPVPNVAEQRKRREKFRLDEAAWRKTNPPGTTGTLRL
ncbi:ATP-binding cassette domain-containing protein [Microbacterium sp. PA5]|uniref:ATP-binding cassette domain-containing protein n=1 Tax=Microbacterium sp. PA5 TaxID=3416654 RepID=UPI003CF74B54